MTSSIAIIPYDQWHGLDGDCYVFTRVCDGCEMRVPKNMVLGGNREAQTVFVPLHFAEEQGWTQAPVQRD